MKHQLHKTIGFIFLFLYTIRWKTTVKKKSVRTSLSWSMTRPQKAPSAAESGSRTPHPVQSRSAELAAHAGKPKARWGCIQAPKWSPDSKHTRSSNHTSPPCPREHCRRQSLRGRAWCPSSSQTSQYPRKEKTEKEKKNESSSQSRQHSPAAAGAHGLR